MENMELFFYKKEQFLVWEQEISKVENKDYPEGGRVLKIFIYSKANNLSMIRTSI